MESASGIAIRRSCVDDAEAIRRCLDAVSRERRWLGFVEAPPLAQVREFLASRNLIQFIAVARDAVVGWCDVNRNPLEGFRHSAILGMGLLPGFRGHGLGQELLRRTLLAARAEGLLRIELEVFASNRAAIALYEKHGFAHEGIRRRARLLDGRRALVTGGSRGIGAAIVARLAQEGADVAFTFVSRPGPVDTDMNPADSAFAELLLTQVLAIPRYATAEEIAAFVAYLAGPEAGYVTGASLTIDRGFTAWPSRGGMARVSRPRAASPRGEASR